MNNYYQIMGIHNLASTDEIKEKYKNLKTNNLINDKINEAYYVLSDYHRRRSYDELLEKKGKLSIFNIPFFGYDFDEKYVDKYINDESSPYFIEKNAKSVLRSELSTKALITNQNIEMNEIKRYKIDDSRYLIYKKSNLNGIINKNYYIEKDGKIELIPENKINKIKESFLNKNKSYL